jgi:rhodanese-related sulfurtransferase
MRVLAIALLAASGVGHLSAQQAAGRISIEEFVRLHAADKVLVVDVRDDQAFANDHIPGAVNIPLGDEERAEHYNRLKAEKRPIVTYCS